MVIAYLGLLWWMLVAWSQALRNPSATGRDAVSRPFAAALAFLAGLSVLVRPELALVGVGVLLMMLVAARSWRRRLLIVVAGGLLPVLYQIFRMGYYALIVPGTAVAKDATGAKWTQGFTYLTNFAEPYLLWVPAVLLVLIGVVLLSTRSRPWWIRHRPPPGYGRLARLVQSPATVVLFIVVSGLIQGVYWIRQGGDFMHGRVLLTPLFCTLLPVSVIPVVLPDGSRISRETGYLLAGATSVLWLAVAGWALWAANSPGMGPDATRVTDTGIVDERRFYAQATGHAHPLTAADYLDYPRMRAVITALENTPTGRCCCPRATTTCGTWCPHCHRRRTPARTTSARTRCSSPTSACSA